MNVYIVGFWTPNIGKMPTGYKHTEYVRAANVHQAMFIAEHDFGLYKVEYRPHWFAFDWYLDGVTRLERDRSPA